MISRLSDSKAFFAVVFMLVIFGLLMVFSASSVEGLDKTGSSYSYFLRQGLFALIGLGILVAAAKMDYMKIKKYAPVVAPVLLIISVALLIVVLIPSIGIAANGARRWIDVGLFKFQPSEAAKLAVILYAAVYLARFKGKIEDAKDLYRPLIVAGVVGALILAEPDLGTTGMILISILVLLFLAGAKLRHLGIIIATVAGAGYVAVISESYRLARFTAFLDPWADPQGSGYQVVQSMIAFGSGGLTGVGLGMSRQKFSYLPEAYSDFVFAVIGEELGLIGSLVVIMLFIAFAYFGFRIAFRATDNLGKLLAGGLTFAVMVQAVINIGAATSVLPVTGIPLPYISAGGTALILNMAGAGLILSIARSQRLGVVKSEDSDVRRRDSGARVPRTRSRG